MMGDSAFMSRNQLLDLKKGWVASKDSSFKKKLFEQGHEDEYEARKILEVALCDEFPALVGVAKIDGISIGLLSSFDGFSKSSVIWEHKSWNTTLAANVRNRTLEPFYFWQLEHQMLTANSYQCAFQCSDGTLCNSVSMVYKSVPERRSALIAGWKQFITDLGSHEIKAKHEVIKAVKSKSLPEITFNVYGTEISTNITDVLHEIKLLSQEEANKTPETDQDFADKEQLNKDVKITRKNLKETVSKVRGNFVSYSQFEKMAVDVDSVLQKMQSHGEKLVKEAKANKIKSIINDALAKFHAHIALCNPKTMPLGIFNIMGNKEPDFNAVVKNKRTIESLESAVDDELSKCKVKVNQAMARVLINMKFIEEEAKEYEFLFRDLSNLVDQESEPFRAIVKNRISEHIEAEKRRVERVESFEADERFEADAHIERVAEKLRVKRIEEEERSTPKDDQASHKQNIINLCIRDVLVNIYGSELAEGAVVSVVRAVVYKIAEGCIKNIKMDFN